VLICELENLHSRPADLSTREDIFDIGFQSIERLVVEQKVRSPPDFDFQCEYKPSKCGLSILSFLKI